MNKMNRPGGWLIEYYFRDVTNPRYLGKCGFSGNSKQRRKQLRETVRELLSGGGSIAVTKRTWCRNGLVLKSQEVARTYSKLTDGRRIGSKLVLTGWQIK